MLDLLRWLAGFLAAFFSRHTASGSYFEWPSPIFLVVPPLLLTGQCALIFLQRDAAGATELDDAKGGKQTRSNAIDDRANDSRNALKPASATLSPTAIAYTRIALLPISLYGIYTSCDFAAGAAFKPHRDYVQFNTVIQLAKFWACIRTVEFAFADTRDYEWIGYERAYGESKEEPRDSTKSKAGPRNGRYAETVLFRAWLNVCTLRGIGYRWGLQGVQIPPVHPQSHRHSRALDFHFIGSLLLRVLWSHVLTVAALVYVVNARQHSASGSAFLYTYLDRKTVGENALLDLLGRMSQVLAFGLAIYTVLECGYSLLTLVTYLLTCTLRAIIPASSSNMNTSFLASLRPDPFRPEAWPRLSVQPVYSTSLADFWGKRWHALFRRIFVAVGSKSFNAFLDHAGLGAKIGHRKGKLLKMMAGTVGAFATSGVLHECFNHATPWKNRDPYYFTLLFFTLQPVGIFIERAVASAVFGQKELPKSVGRMWTWSFLLATGLLMTETWVNRGVIDNQPVLQDWTWRRWYLPLAFIFPDLSKPRLHQLAHLRPRPNIGRGRQTVRHLAQHEGLARRGHIDISISNMDRAVDAFKPATGITLIPHAILWLQATLLFARVPAARTMGLSSDALAKVRLALLPVAVCAIWTCYTNKHAVFYPQREWIHLNMTLCVGRAWSILKAIEYATADPEAYKWMGYKWAYSLDRSVVGEKDKGDKILRDADEAGEKVANEEIGHAAAAPVAQRPTPEAATTWKCAAWLGWRNLWALRGIGWSYGLRGEMIPPRYPQHRSLVLCLLGRILWSHALGISCLIYILHARELSSDPSYILHHYTGLQEHSTILSIIGKLLQSAAFGIAIYASIETDSAYFTLSIYSLTHLLRIIIPTSLSSIRPNAFNLDAWPKLSRRPLSADSIAYFWGYRWHGLFRVPFLAVGFKPATALLRRIGCRDRTLLLALGSLAAFMLSGFIHEGFNDATPWLARDPYYRSMTFFALQSLGIVLENTFTRLTGRKVGGTCGRLWAWAFLLSTGTLMAGCWISRGFVDNEPPLTQWEWWRWCVPNAAVMPSMNRVRMYQLRLLDDACKGV